MMSESPAEQRVKKSVKACIHQVVGEFSHKSTCIEIRISAAMTEHRLSRTPYVTTDAVHEYRTSVCDGQHAHAVQLSARGAELHVVCTKATQCRQLWLIWLPLQNVNCQGSNGYDKLVSSQDVDIPTKRHILVAPSIFESE